MKELDEFISSLKDHDKSNQTLEAYSNDIIQFLDEEKINDISEINIKVLESYKNKLMFEKFLAPTSVSRKIISINQFLKFNSIPLELKGIKIQNQNFLDSVINNVEVKSLINMTEEKKDIRAKALFLTLLFTGMRISECLQLKLEDVYKDTITIVGKGNKIRSVFIPKQLKDVWMQYCRVRQKGNGTDKLFTGQKGPICRQTAHRMLKKYGTLCNIDFNKTHLHNFRHLYCKNLSDKNIPIETIADLAGHSSIETTRKYTQKSKEELLDTINSLF